MKKLVLATYNAGKRREFDELLAPLGIEVLSAAELELPEPDETGDSFRANALIKAHATMTRARLPALADDSGLCIPSLGGQPGIHSARWAGDRRDYAMAFKRIRHELAGHNPAAYFICVLCLQLPGGEVHYFEGRVDGTLVFPPRGVDGFGYDPVFMPEGFNITFAEMPGHEKQRLSHRARAASALVAFLQKSA